MWLSRIEVKREDGLSSLGPLLVPNSDDERVSVGHRMMWSIFPDTPKPSGNEPRPFLWREEARGRFIVLSRRAARGNGLLEVTDSAEFKPVIKNRDRLLFRLRANPTITTKRAGVSGTNPRRGKRTDVVMDAISSTPKGDRAQARNEQLGWGETPEGSPLLLKAPGNWLERQGQQYGFDVEQAVALGYQTLRVPRADGRRESKRPMRIGVVEFEGVVTIANPEEFIARLPLGFGSAKAFGCGLMLIRRA
ncbi:MAG: type I-E CRISPR-associated protein Cas6/Cse3/CasE [Alphaproteobacteria bacterium]|nr:type I-E CRISPR-associated protein Cas6/Cse3/CasE [Alphaproteobacteria bacterium]